MPDGKPGLAKNETVQPHEEVVKGQERAEERFSETSENQTLNMTAGIPLFFPTAIGKMITFLLQR
ncbi:hypothetical protein BDD12DRAFT_905509 [Trichophaea hybrida]|nr:hypothetical protein BDD12DRAFT_905509 [Trichophaea hybrida]